jgi:tRNA A37 threonylcarbamoyltransferase TsaD
MTIRDILSAAAPGLAASATGAGALAWLMRGPAFAYGHLCGHAPADLHCPACYAAVALLLLGLASSVLAVGAPEPAARVVRATRRN